ncbi:hypothetical protein GCM10009854_36270 [Saccharopolyspora halophila]|uniref:Amine oxidase domain-containing protein n=1 Tax=Saccharopolyspora halophila TaxID=405551 RepID=A0ABN3GLI0_9PSEU
MEPFANRNANAPVCNEQTGAGPHQFRTVEADVHGYISELLSKALDRGSLDQEVSAEDKERLLEFLTRFGDIGGRADAFAYTGSSRRGYAVEPGAADQPGQVLGPPPSLHEVIAGRTGRYLTFELGYDQAMMMFQPVGGMDAISTALHRAIGADVVALGAEVARRAVEQGAKIHGPVYRAELDDAFSVAWNRTPFIEGGTAIWPDRGSGEYALLNEPAGRVYFAGDWLSYFTGWQAGAMDSARYVVQALHRRVCAEG